MQAMQGKIIASNLYASYSWFHANTPGLTVHQTGAFTCLYAPNGLDDFNLALPSPHTWSGTFANVADAPNARSALFKDLEAVHAFFATRDTSWACFFPHGGSEEGADEKRKEETDTTLPDAAALGFSEYIDHLVQYLALEHLHVPDSARIENALPESPAYSIRRVSRPEDIDAFADLTGAGWNIDPVPYRRFFQSQAVRLLAPGCPKQWYIAWVDGRPASCIECFLQPDTATAGLYYVTTHPDFRRQGLSLHLQASALTAARAQGCTHATVLSSPSEASVVRKLGFTDCGYWSEYIHD